MKRRSMSLVLAAVAGLVTCPAFARISHGNCQGAEKQIAVRADDISAVKEAVAARYQGQAVDVKVVSYIDPVIGLGNSVMALQPYLRALFGSKVRNYEVAYRLGYSIAGQQKDCMAMITVGTQWEVNVGVCNQSYLDFANWTEEFQETVSPCKQ